MSSGPCKEDVPALIMFMLLMFGMLGIFLLFVFAETPTAEEQRITQATSLGKIVSVEPLSSSSALFTHTQLKITCDKGVVTYSYHKTAPMIPLGVEAETRSSKCATYFTWDGTDYMYVIN